MPDETTRMKDILFDHVTTYRTAYRAYETRAYEPTSYQAKPRCVRIRPPPLSDIHTLSQWKNPVPFGMLHRPRPIINTNPRNVQEKFVKPIDELKEEVRKTRPRLVMTPAVSMDDVLDPRAREILVDDMYTCDMTKGLREAVSSYTRVTAPLPGLPAPANPIVLPKLQPPLVSPEWRMETVSWDSKQLRAHCDPNKRFWLEQIVPECRACRETEIITNQRTVIRKLKSES